MSSDSIIPHHYPQSPVSENTGCPRHKENTLETLGDSAPATKTKIDAANWWLTLDPAHTERRLYFCTPNVSPANL